MNTNGNPVVPGDLLKTINYPSDLRKLKESQLPQVCKELREYIIDIVSRYGGHFGGSLGTVELTVAVHYVFDTPNDLFVWDIGHQAYGHKILTGRRERFHTNRLYKGISGFLKRSESEYDVFGAGHSSTSVSAALGMAVANQYKNDTRHHVAIIGDGAMTAGMAFEALNNAGTSQANLLIILNDNCMSIDPNVGALKEYLTEISASHTYNKVKDEVWQALGKLSTFGKSAREIVSRMEKSLKTMITKPGMLFESLKLRYFGPIDGHDIHKLVHVLRDLKDVKGPKILHAVTVKGKGFSLAEKEQTKWHAASSAFDKITGKFFSVKSDTPKPPKYQDVFGHTMVELAEMNPKIIGITPAMPSGSSMNIMMQKMPHRAFDVGICEQHAVTFSAGLATQGLIPFCNIYSSFMQRAYDQIVHDVCIQNLHVIFCLDRAGLAGADGPTHHGNYDFAYMRCLPNIIVSAPMNEQELRSLMFTAAQENLGPFTIRYPRGEGVMTDWKTPLEILPIGKGRRICDGEEIAILSVGHIGNYVTEARKVLELEDIFPAHYDLRYVKPLDDELLHEIFSKYKKIITLEDHAKMGGFGSAILEWMAEHNAHPQIKVMGIEDRVVEHGTQRELHHELGIDPEGIVNTVREMLGIKIVKESVKV